ncbi:MAG: aldose 1-epimerase family protein [Blautia sp.]|nr:aldose 1-epimerase family protein [Blautia sp.]
MRKKLENESLLIEIEDTGAELVRIFDKEKQREVLWSGDPTYWGRHAPLLFPNVGRHWQDQYQVNGKSFPSKQHGFARDMAFTCIEHSKRQVVHQLQSDEATLEKYPFAFLLNVRHTLEGRRITVQWEVENPAEGPMYFTIGGHPAFRVPVNEESYSDYQLHFPGESSLTYLLIDPDGNGTVDAEHPHTLLLDKASVPLGPLKDGEQVLSEHFFDLDALIFDDAQITEAQILLPDGSEYVKLHCESFPCFGIWAAPDAPFVCLEPWMGRADDKGFTGSLEQKPNINRLEKRSVFTKSYQIEIC